MNKVFFLAALAAASIGITSTSSVSVAANNSSKNVAKPTDRDLLIKLASPNAANGFVSMLNAGGASAKPVFGNWVQVNLPAPSSRFAARMNLNMLLNNSQVAYIQPNYKIRLLENYQTKDSAVRAQLAKILAERPLAAKQDNLPFPTKTSGGSGADPDFAKQWGMNDIGVKLGWKQARGEGVVVAVIDTGVDYTHEDLVDNMWRNPGESGTDASGKDKSTNGIDDDANGYVDDLMGWDFAKNDNKPYDLAVEPIELLTGGGNPGHGTHCAGNVAAAADNGKGVVGVAPKSRIMAIRFLSEKGEGDTMGAIQSIQYAVKNGAKVLSNSWGSEGDDPAEEKLNQALKDAITEAQNAGALFVAAAGNGHQGVGYDNDTDAKPAFPASYDHENIISVAASDSKDALGSFSNWGAKTVDIAAPGVKVYSTTVGGKYSDMVIDLFGIQASWDGTSMACPHVAGAAALYWSVNPNATWREVKGAIMSSSKKISAMAGKSVSGGKLDVQTLMK